MNNSRHITFRQRIIAESVQLSRNPSAPSRTSGASGLSGTQARAGVGVAVEAGVLGGSLTRPVEIGGVIVTQRPFMLGMDELDDPSAILL